MTFSPEDSAPFFLPLPETEAGGASLSLNAFLQFENALQFRRREFTLL